MVNYQKSYVKQLKEKLSSSELDICNFILLDTDTDKFIMCGEAFIRKNSDDIEIKAGIFFSETLSKTINIPENKRYYKCILNDFRLYRGYTNYEPYIVINKIKLNPTMTLKMYSDRTTEFEGTMEIFNDSDSEYVFKIINIRE